MARVALVQNFAYEYLGILYIEAALRREGHQVEVFLDLGNQKKLLSEIKSFICSIFKPKFAILMH